jgi:hypothetical protein
MASQTENEAFCKKLNGSLPGIVTVGLDAFAIRDGKRSNCEDHSEEEWQDLMKSEQYGVIGGLDASLNVMEDKPKNGEAIYRCIIDTAIQKHIYEIEGLKKVVTSSPCHNL